MEEWKSQLKNMFYEGGFFGYGLNSVAGVYCSLYSSNIHNMLDFNSSRFFWRLHTHAFFDDAMSIIQKIISLQCVLVKRYSAAAFIPLHVLLIAMFTHSHHHPFFLIHGVTRI